MTRPTRDEKREERIHMEIIVDAYGSEEQALGWYYYLEENLHTPFTARCIAHLATSPLHVGEEVKVIGMPPEQDCEHTMLAMIQWQGRKLAVPLQQLEGLLVDEETLQAIEDWQYWVSQGYEL